MADPIVETKVTTDASTAGADVKPSPTVLGSQSSTQGDDTTKTDAADAVKAGETPKTDAEKEVAAKAAADAEAFAADAPEKYEAFKVPETVKLDEQSVTEFQTVSKELNLSQGKAQKVMDLAVKHTEKVAAQLKQASEKALADAGEAWRKEIETDKEFGGSNFKTSNEAALIFRDKFTTPKERESLAALFNSGWGNHPVLWKMLVRAGKAMREDTAVDGGVTTPEVSAAKVMFPSMK